MQITMQMLRSTQVANTNCVVVKLSVSWKWTDKQQKTSEDIRKLGLGLYQLLNEKINTGNSWLIKGNAELVDPTGDCESFNLSLNINATATVEQINALLAPYSITKFVFGRKTKDLDVIPASTFAALLEQSLRREQERRAAKDLYAKDNFGRYLTVAELEDQADIDAVWRREEIEKERRRTEEAKRAQREAEQRLLQERAQRDQQRRAKAAGRVLTEPVPCLIVSLGTIVETELSRSVDAFQALCDELNLGIDLSNPETMQKLGSLFHQFNTTNMPEDEFAAKLMIAVEGLIPEERKPALEQRWKPWQEVWLERWKACWNAMSLIDEERAIRIAKWLTSLKGTDVVWYSENNVTRFNHCMAAFAAAGVTFSNIRSSHTANKPWNELLLDILAEKDSAVKAGQCTLVMGNFDLIQGPFRAQSLQKQKTIEALVAEHGLRCYALKAKCMSVVDAESAVNLCNDYWSGKPKKAYVFSAQLPASAEDVSGVIEVTMFEDDFASAKATLQLMLLYWQMQSLSRLQCKFESQGSLVARMKNFADKLSGEDPFVVKELAGNDTLKSYHARHFGIQQVSVCVLEAASENQLSVVMSREDLPRLEPLAYIANPEEFCVQLCDEFILRNTTVLDMLTLHLELLELRSKCWQAYNSRDRIEKFYRENPAYGDLVAMLKARSEAFRAEISADSLAEAAYCGRESQFETELLKRGVNCRLTSLGLTPLMLVVMQAPDYGFEKEVWSATLKKLAVLEKHGANFNARDVFGRNAAFWLKPLAGIFCGVRSKDMDSPDIVASLLANKTDPLATDRHGYPVVNYLRRQGSFVAQNILGHLDDLLTGNPNPTPLIPKPAALTFREQAPTAPLPMKRDAPPAATSDKPAAETTTANVFSLRHWCKCC